MCPYSIPESTLPSITTPALMPVPSATKTRLSIPLNFDWARANNARSLPIFTSTLYFSERGFAMSVLVMPRLTAARIFPALASTMPATPIPMPSIFVLVVVMMSSMIVHNDLMRVSGQPVCVGVFVLWVITPF